MRANPFVVVMVLISVLVCFSCDSSSVSDTDTIYDRLTNSLHIDQSVVEEGDLSAGTADPTAPQVSDFDWPENFYFDVANTFKVSTDFANFTDISYLLILINGASGYIKVPVSFTADTSGSSAQLNIQLMNDEEYSGKSFTARFALMLGSGEMGFPNSATFTVSEQNTVSCTTDSVGAVCDDSNKCTTDDVCSEYGVCAGTAVVCGEHASCDAASGACLCENGYSWQGGVCVLDNAVDGDGEITDGDDDSVVDGDDDTVTDGDDDVVLPEPTWVCPSKGYTMTEGVNSNFTSANTAREFTIIVPDDEELLKTKLPVIFYFHGSGDSMNNWANNLGIKTYANKSDFPFIGVVFKSLQLQPPSNIAFDWDCLQYDSSNPGANLDATLFIDTLNCMKEGLNIDENAIHVLGFSAGAIMTDLVSIAHSDEIASIAAYSGAYFSDLTQKECILGMCAEWSAYNTTNKFPALISWGGTADTYPLNYGIGQLDFDFNQKALDTIAYLNGNHHDLVSCDHGLGHTVGGTQLSWAYTFFKDHPRGTFDSPYRAGLPANMSTCEFKQKQ